MTWRDDTTAGPADPVAAYRMLAPLRVIRRFSTYPTAVPQSVADHSFYTGLLAMLFGRLYNEYVLDHAPGVPLVDTHRVLMFGALHDAEEAASGDVAHPFKRLTPELLEAWEAAAEQVRKQMLALVGFPSGLQPTPLEALLVKLADWTELLLYEEQERQMGNTMLQFPARKIWALLEGKLTQDFAAAPPPAGAWYAQLLETYLRRRLVTDAYSHTHTQELLERLEVSS